MKTFFTYGQWPKSFDRRWNPWIQVQVDNFNVFLFCSSNPSRFFDWNFEIGIVNSLDPIKITHSKNSSPCAIKSIYNLWIFFKSNFKNQRDAADNNSCSSNYSLSNWYSGVSRSCYEGTSISCFLCFLSCLHQNFMIIPKNFSWSYITFLEWCNLGSLLNQFSSVLYQLFCSLFWQKLYWCIFFQIFILVWKETYWSFLLFCRYLSSGNIKCSVKPLSKNSKILADFLGPTNWRDVKW